MAILLKQSTAKAVSFGPFVDKTDGVTPETGLVSALDHASTGIMLSKNGGALTIRHATVTASSYDAYGNYIVTLDTTDTNTLGTLRMQFIETATCLPVWMDFMVVPAMVYDSLVAGTDDLDVNAKKWNDLTTVALPLIPTTAGRTLDVSATGEAGLDWANVGSPTTTLALTGTTIAVTQKVDVDTVKTNPVVNGGTFTFPTNATGASTTNITAGVITTVTTVTNQLTAAAIATGVWQDTTAGDFTTALSVGKSIMNGVTLGTGLTVARCTLTDTLTTYTGNTVQTGDSFARIGVAGAGLTAVALTGTQAFNNTGTWTGNIVGTLSTLTTYTGNTVQTGDSFARIGAAGVGLTAVALADATSDAVIADAVWNAATASYGTAGTYGLLIETDLDATVSSRLASASYTAPSNLTAAQIATGVWQDTTAGDFTTALSVGKSLMNGVTLGIGLTVARCTLADTVTTLTNLPAITAGWLTATGIAADAITAAKIADGTIDTATFASGTTIPRCTLVDTVTAVTGLTAADVGAIKAKTDSLTFTVAAQVDCNVIDWKSATAPAMTGDAFARLGAPAGASVSADVAAVKVDAAAVKVQTDKLTFTVANQIDANVLDWKSATAPAMTGDAFARLGAPAGASVSADIAAAKVDTAAIKVKTDFLPSATAGAASGVAIVGSAMTLAVGQVIADSQTAGTVGAALLGMEAQAIGKWTIVGTTLTLYRRDGTTVVRTFTLDSATAPTSRT